MRLARKLQVRPHSGQNNFASLRSRLMLPATWVTREVKAARVGPLLESSSGYECGLGAIHFALDRLYNLDVDFD